MLQDITPLVLILVFPHLSSLETKGSRKQTLHSIEIFATKILDNNQYHLGLFLFGISYPLLYTTNQRSSANLNDTQNPTKQQTHHDTQPPIHEFSLRLQIRANQPVPPHQVTTQQFDKVHKVPKPVP
jgi:hypothetical protein